MNLIRIHFEAYKSLIGKTLDINDQCIGLVGINESGKSNVLHAISVLSDGVQLQESDTPRVDHKKPDPSIKFDFSLTKEEWVDVLSTIGSVPANLVEHVSESKDIFVQYHVKFDRSAGEEFRSFAIQGVTLPDDIRLRSRDAKVEGYAMLLGDAAVSLDSVYFVQASDIDKNEDLAGLSIRKSDLQGKLAEIQASILEITSSVADEADIGPEDMKLLASSRSKAGKIQQQVADLEESLGDFDIEHELNRHKVSLGKAKNGVKNLDASISALRKEAREYEVLIDAGAITQEQQDEYANCKSKIESSEKRLRSKRTAEQAETMAIEAIEQPLSAKFTSDPEVASSQLGKLITPHLKKLLPRVVFWTNNSNFVLQGETLFDEMQKVRSLSRISRPLVNIFRIALQVDSLSRLKCPVETLFIATRS